MSGRERRTRSRSASRSRSRSGPRRNRGSSKSRTYKPPHQQRQQQQQKESQATPRSEADIPQALYIATDSPESGLTDEGPGQRHSFRHSRSRSWRAQKSKSPNYDEDDARAYRLADNPYNGDVNPVSPHHREKLNRWYKKKFPMLSKSISNASDTIDRTLSGDSRRTFETLEDTVAGEEHASRRMKNAEGDYVRTKQSFAYFSILLTSVQLLVLVLQLTMCGLAPLDVNGFVGPYPDQFSEWGGKNPYLMLYDNEWWRLVSPSLLHVGILHLLINAFCQLEAIAFFEREWGSFRWVLVYLISSVGSSAFSSFFDPDTIAVGSSGAIMGMYGAKLAQVVTVSSFDLQETKFDEVIRMDQLSSVLCGMTIVFVMTAFSYVDWSGHVGGMVCGFCTGIVFFSNPIDGCCTWFFWVTGGLLSLIASLGAVIYFFITATHPDEDIADPCEYFRSFFPEDYDCNCIWQ